MTAMMIDDGKRVAAGGARLQWHMIPIADIDLIATKYRGKENGVTFDTLLERAHGFSVRSPSVLAHYCTFTSTVFGFGIRRFGR